MRGDNGAAIANAITPTGCAPCKDAHGGHVGSLTEAVMSVGASLDGVAESLRQIAEAIRELKARAEGHADDR